MNACCSDTTTQGSSTISAVGPAAAVNGALAARVQSQAGLILGYLCFDGEVTRSDKQEAVRHFKLSAAAGWGRESREAAQVLGWIWNTGEHGAQAQRVQAVALPDRFCGTQETCDACQHNLTLYHLHVMGKQVTVHGAVGHIHRPSWSQRLVCDPSRV